MPGLEHHISVSRARSKAQQLDFRHPWSLVVPPNQLVVWLFYGRKTHDFWRQYSGVKWCMMYDVWCMMSHADVSTLGELWLYPATMTEGSKAQGVLCCVFGTGADPLVLKQKATILGLGPVCCIALGFIILRNVFSPNEEPQEAICKIDWQILTFVSSLYSRCIFKCIFTNIHHKLLQTLRVKWPTEMWQVYLPVLKTTRSWEILE